MPFRCGPGTFQTLVSVLGLRVREILCGPLKNEVLVSCSPLAPPELSPDGFQSQTLWGLIFLVQIPRAGGAHCRAWTSPSSGRTSTPQISLLLMVCCAGVLIPTMAQPLAPFLMWLFLLIFSCGRAVLLVFRLFLEKVTQCVVAAVVCLGEEVSSGSSYLHPS